MDLTALAPAIIDQAGDALIVIDGDNIIRVWNAKATALFGFTPEQALGSAVHLIIPERLRAPHDRAFSAAMERGSLASDGEARRTKAVTAAGETIYIAMSFAILRDAAGEAVGSIAVARKAPQRPAPSA